MEQVKGLLTIGIPTYNGAANFLDLFASISLLGLNTNELEIIVVDNCSADDTEAVLKQAAEMYPNLHYHINETNIGRIENWNRVVDLARGEYLIIMNVNDRFLNFNARRYIHYLNKHPEVSTVLANLQYTDHVYPNWLEEGLVNLNGYLRKTMLDWDYLEFHSLGVLHQHIYRTEVIRANKLVFDPSIPRTTDRVFTARVIKAGNGLFFYTTAVMASWHLNQNRYHHQVHLNNQDFDFEQLYVNEYKANKQLAEIARIPFPLFLKSQLVSASFSLHIRKLRRIKDLLLRSKTPTIGLEVPTAHLFYDYLKKEASGKKVAINYLEVKRIALKRAFTWYLRSLNLVKKHKRTLKGIIRLVNY